MNKKDLIQQVASEVRDSGFRKPVTIPKHVLHVSDDEGNQKDFVIKQADKTTVLTIQDVAQTLDAFFSVVADAVRRGETVAIPGFGKFGVKYRQPRATKMVGTDEWITIEGRYVPYFSFGKELQMCARSYEKQIKDEEMLSQNPFSDFDDFEDDADNEGNE